MMLVRCPLASLGRYMSAHLLSRLVRSPQTLSHIDGYTAVCPVAMCWWRAIRVRVIFPHAVMLTIILQSPMTRPYTDEITDLLDVLYLLR